MPYLITDSAEGCSGWATIKDDGEIMGCHETKQEAIDQALAIARAEGSEFLGERSTRELPDNYRPATTEDVPEGRACGNCIFFNEENLDEEGRAYCERWEDYVEGGFYCNAWEGEIEARQEDDSSTPAPPEDQITGSDVNEPGSAEGPGGSDIELSEATETALRNKVEEHNERMESEDKPAYTRTTYGQLSTVYRRGAGAYSTSHRPGVSRGAWAMARVNAYLYLLRNGRPENSNYVTDNDLLPEEHPRSTRRSLRDVNLEPPAYMRASARRGLEWHREGLSGDGLVDRTVREAVAMSEGNVTADKWNRIAAWIARHLVDLDAPAAESDHPDYPSPGVVAMALWGGGATKRQANRALEYAQGVVARLEAENQDRSTATGEAVSKLETRTITADLEVREEPEGMTLTGYAARFNEASEPLPFRETIAPGAFKRSLQSRNDIKLLWNHDSSMVLGSTRAGTLTLTEDAQGLRVSAQLPDTTAGRDAKVLIARGDVTGFSFGFTVPEGGDSWNADGSERTLNSVRLFEVSTGVAFPAYPTTNGTAQVRGLEKIALRADVDVDKLADTLLKLEAGQEITGDDRKLMDTILNELTVLEETEEASASEEDNGKALLALKKKKLELLMGL